MNNDQLLNIFETTLLPRKNCKNFEFLYDKYQKKEVDDHFYKELRSVTIGQYEKIIEDTYLFFISVLKLEKVDALAAVNRILEKCRLNKIKEPRYHLVSDQRLKEQYKKIYGKTNFKEFYINYLKTAIKNE